MLVVQLLPLPRLWADWLSAKPVPLSHSGVDAESDLWRGLSLTPAASWAAAVSLLSPVAVFLGVSQLDAVQRFRLTAVVIALGAAGLLVGFLQVVQGPGSALRFYQFTNPSEAVGFFANRNHFAAALYTMLIFAAVWFAYVARDFLRSGAFNTHAVVWFAAAAALLIATVAGLALARSRAGIFLAFAAALGILAMILVGRRSSHRHRGTHDGERSVRGMLIAALVFAMLFAAQFGLQRVMTRFQTDSLDDLRFALTPVTLQIAWESLPFGTGLGSFPPVYATAEKTADLFTGYANRAHNDWAEFLLEGGVFAAIIMLLFLWWFVRRAAAVWQRRQRGEHDEHLMLERGATLVIALLLAHSFVDYPLRTSAMAAIFAFACALLIAAPEPALPQEKPEPRRRRRRSAPNRPSMDAPQRPRDDDDIVWPDAWKRGS